MDTTTTGYEEYLVVHPVHYRGYGTFHAECGDVPTHNRYATTNDDEVTCDTCRWWRKTQDQYQY